MVLYSKNAGATNWTTVNLNGYPPTKMATYGGVPLVTVGLDGSSNEVPYMLGYEWVFGFNASDFRCAIYYMTTIGTNITWETSDALRYPKDTHIKVMFWDDLVVGTSIGLYGQVFHPNASVKGDYDGDGKSDLAVYHDGYWSIYSIAHGVILNNAGVWGGSGWVPAPGDYDGDGEADLAVYHDGYWSIYSIANGVILNNAGVWGGPDWFPVPGNYDGDGKADLAVYRDGYWSICLMAGSVFCNNAGVWGGPDWDLVR
ncbi:MAG: VCBS repeat-containing protein [Lentisphaerota bacterium]